MTRFLATLWGTFFFSGRFPFASGTAGSAAAMIPLCAILYFLPVPVYASLLSLGIFLFVVLGVPAASYLEKTEGKKDPGCVVIDEAAGQWMAFLFVPAVLLKAHPWLLVLGFLLFRFFDITKIFPANRAEKLHGGVGIMADDLIAGLYACLVLNIIVKLWLK